MPSLQPSAEAPSSSGPSLRSFASSRPIATHVSVETSMVSCANCNVRLIGHWLVDRLVSSIYKSVCVVTLDALQDLSLKSHGLQGLKGA